MKLRALLLSAFLGALGLSACGGGGSSQPSDDIATGDHSEVDSAGSGYTGLNSDQIAQSINASTSVECELSAGCRWVSPDSGLSISINDANPFFFQVESTRDTQITITPYVAVQLGSAELQLDAFDIEGRACTSTLCQGVSRDLPAGRPVFISTGRRTGFNAPHRTDFSVVALEFSEQGGESQFAK